MQRTPKSKFSSSPDISNATTGENMTQRKRKKPESEITEAIQALSMDLNKKIEDMRGDMNSALDRLTENMINIRTDLAAISQVTIDIKNELNILRLDHNKLDNRVNKLETKQHELMGDITSIQKSVEYTMDQQEVLKSKIDSTCSTKTSAETMQNTICSLEAKVDSMEEQARQCNLELCNVPEKRNENLLNLMDTICTQIKFPLSQKDILAIHRVPHAHKDNKMPKNIIVKLSSRILRDNLLSSFRLAKGLNTNQLGFSGTLQPTFMHEHLTLKKKHLFRQARDAVRKNNYKYIWVKHSTILVREIDSEPAIAIRSIRDIDKIRPNILQTK